MADEAILKAARDALGRAAGDVEACRNEVLDARVAGEMDMLVKARTELDAALARLCTAADAYRAAGGRLGESKQANEGGEG